MSEWCRLLGLLAVTAVSQAIYGWSYGLAPSEAMMRAWFISGGLIMYGLSVWFTPPTGEAK